MSRARLFAEEKYSIVHKLSQGDVGISALSSEYHAPKQTIYKWKDQYDLYELKVKCSSGLSIGGVFRRDICMKYRVSHGALQKWINKYNSHKEFKNTHQGKSIMTTSRKLSFEMRMHFLKS